jgi:hypothetical protein
MKKYLVKLADHLDKKGLYKEANYLDWVIKKASEAEKSYPESFDSLSDEELYSLSAHVGKNYKEQFEGELVSLLTKLVPDVTEGFLKHVVNKSEGFQEKLENAVKFGNSVTGATKDFLLMLVGMAERDINAQKPKDISHHESYEYDDYYGDPEFRPRSKGIMSDWRRPFDL